MTILTPERLAEIAERAEEARAATGWETVDYAAYAAEAPIDTLAILASHAALQAEVERLRGHLDKRNEEYLTMNSHAADLQDELTTARESAAREMREMCAENLRGFLLVAEACLEQAKASGNDHYVSGWSARIMALKEAISDTEDLTLPLTPTKENADG